jgi:hypothetical protein
MSAIRLKILCCLLLLIVTASLYSRVANFPFLPNDDLLYVGDPHIQAGLNWTTFKFAFTAIDVGYPTPLTFLSHALDFEIYGPNAGAHHLTSVLLHTLNVVILFLLLLQATGAMGRSLLVTALFALHPLNVESVAWVAERKNVLSTLFFLIALGAYGWYAQKPSVKRYLTVAILFVLGLASKPMVITLPFVLLLLDFWPLKRIEGWGEPSVPNPHRRTNRQAQPQFSAVPATFSRLVLGKLPLLVLCVGSAIWSVVGQSEIIHEPTKVPLGARLENAIYSYGLYIRDTFWPAALANSYPFTLGYSFNILAACKVGLVVSFLAAISVLVWKQRFARRYLVTGWLWYLGTLVPVSGIIWMGNYSRADRYAYIPLIGIFVMVVWRAADWCDSNKINLDVRTVISLTALAVLSFLTWIQVGYWQSNYERWAHSVKVEPNNPWAQAQLATVVFVEEMAQPDSRKADAAELAMGQAWVDYYRDQLKRAPLDPSTEILLIKNLVGIGHEADAIVEYRKVIGPTPDPYMRAVLHVTPDPYMRAYLYAEIAGIAREADPTDHATVQSSWSQVRESFKQALKADPSRIAEKVAQWSAFVENNPSPWGYTLLGIFEQESGHFSNAFAAFDKAHQLDPTYDPTYLSTLGGAITS